LAPQRESNQLLFAIRISRQRIYVIQRLLISGLLPDVPKFLLVLRRPFHHQSRGARSELSRDHSERLNVDDYLVATMFRVKMRRLMVIVEHPDHDAVEATDFRHEQTLS
jgi:hypothetical protein